METPFLSFSNPNYQFDSHKSKKVHKAATDVEPADINVMSLTDDKQEPTKVLNGKLRSQNSTDDENVSVKSEEVVSDEENDYVDADAKLLTQNEDEKLDNTECGVNMTYGEKPKGILAYISLLEQSARERSERRKKELEISDNYLDDCDSGQSTPLISENLKQKT